MSPSKWFSSQGSIADAKSILFCLPFCGGGSLAFAGWKKQFPADIAVCPIIYPGRDGRRREPFYSSLTDLVTDLHCEILPLLDKPFAFFGHSLGALIAFELIRSLQKVGKEPQIFFASAHRPPKQPLYKPPIHQLPEQLFEEKIQQYGGTPSLILEDAELKKFFFSILRADFTLWETYRYSSGERLACPIVLLAGKQDVTVSLDDLPLWQEETSSRCPLYLLNGGHFFLKDSQKEVIEIIQRELSSCTAH